MLVLRYIAFLISPRLAGNIELLVPVSQAMVPLAIVLGAIIIAAAIYFRRPT